MDAAGWGISILPRRLAFGVSSIFRTTWNCNQASCNHHWVISMYSERCAPSMLILPALVTPSHALISSIRSFHVLTILLPNIRLPRPRKHQPVSPFLLHLCSPSLRREVAAAAHARYVRRELPQLVSNHVLRYGDLVVHLAIVDLEALAHEVG
jgi:hypothetical protein